MQKNLSISTKPKFGTRQITTIGMLSAISIILGLTRLGFIPLPPPLLNATIMHIPVIIGAILEGPIVGAMVGLIFGIFSMFQAMAQPTPTSFLFFNPLVAVLPRILIGLTTYYVYKIKFIKNDTVRTGISALVGSLTNTIGVLGMIYLIYLDKYAAALGKGTSAVKWLMLSTAGTNGLAEAVISVLITVSVVTAVKKIRK